jgi:HAMP domain-containing protein
MASQKRSLRKRLITDIQVQGALIVRVVIYWMLCLTAIGTLLFLWQMVVRPLSPIDQQVRELWGLYRPAAVVSLLLLPIVVLDMLRLTNRFAGPLFRLRRAMRDLSQGKAVAPIQFRKGDFWQEFAGDFNAIAARMQKSKEGAVEDSQETPDAEDQSEPVGSRKYEKVGCA